MFICLERGADLHTAQLMPLPLTVSCFGKSRFVLRSWYWLTRGVLDKGPLNGCCCCNFVQQVAVGVYFKKGSPYSITERRVPQLITVLGSQPSGDENHKPDGRLPLLFASLQLPPQPLRGLLPVLLFGEQRHNGCEQFA